jgi:hypothetical protein
MGCLECCVHKMASSHWTVPVSRGDKFSVATLKLHGLSPRANYTDRATAACWRSDCQLLRIEGCHVVSVTDPYDRILDFLDRSRYFSIK